MSDGGIRVMVAEPSASIFGPAIREAHQGVEIVAVTKEGTLVLADGTPIDAQDSKIEVAWGTTDLFYEKAQRETFFGLVGSLESMRWFQSPSAGFDMSIFTDIIKSPVTYTRSDIHSVPIAEYIMRAALDHRQQAQRWRDAQAEGRWDHHEWDEVCGTTWVIIGLGSIGSEVAIRARAFGARVIGVRRRSRSDEPVDEMVTPDELHRVLPGADVIALCAPANTSTQHLVDDNFLAHVKPSALLVNIARGSLVDTAAVVRALDTNRLGEAVLDVLENEPLGSDDPLWSHPKVILTPHNSAFSSARLRRQAELFEDNLGRYLRGEPLENLVTRADLD